MIKTQPRVEITKTYKRVKRLLFAPEIETEIPRSKPRTRSQVKRLSKEVVNEEALQVETMREESPRDRYDALLQNEEQIPLEFETIDLGENHGDKAQKT